MTTLPDHLSALGAAPHAVGDSLTAAHFGDSAAEYAACRSGLALCDRGDRGLVVVRGTDRQPWLHNLVTNEVTNLGPAEGNYAFTLDVRGRILFDLNIIVRSDDILLDIDRRWVASALRHLNKYIIMEDVTLHDATAELTVLGLCGAGITARLTSALGLPSRMAQLDHRPVDLEGAAATAVCHDFCGPPGLDLIVPSASAAGVWAMLMAHDARPAGHDAVDILRIEHGIPAPFNELADDILPAETRQLERAVSFNKGCYLGQEVVERMRTHKSLAKQLVGVLFEEPLHGPAHLRIDGKDVGRVTSTARSIQLDRPIGLGYIKTMHAARTEPLRAVNADGEVECRLCALPF